MPRRSKVFDLPPEVRDQLNERLVTCGFQGYEELATWLQDQGFEVSRSGVQRYGQDLKHDFEMAMGEVKKTTELARAWAESDGDQRGDLMAATAHIVQEHLMRISLAIRKAEEEPGKAAKHLATISHAMADLGRMELSQKKWAKEERMELARQAADKASDVARKGGMSEDTVEQIRKGILGIVE